MQTTTSRIPPIEHQIAMVLDLNKCLGCQTCTIACKKLWNTDTGTDYSYWNNVETAPGAGYPRGWPANGGRTPSGNVQRGRIPDLDTEYGRAWQFNHHEVHAGCGEPPAQRPWLRPDGDPSWGPNWDEDHGAGSYPRDNHYFYLPRLCNHCTHPACLDACPRAAIHKRPQDGIVLVDQDRCHGYRFCVEACPYKKVYFDVERQVSTKCIFCFPRVEQGVPPACARQCPGRLRFVGYLEDESGPIWKLVRHWQVALPLHPELGLGPNVFYVPPLSPPALDAQGRPTATPRIPPAYLESLFGSDVHQALATLRREREKRRRGEPSELIDLLVAYDWNRSFQLAPGTREVL
ncbi:MAG TPA: 4Fe-4S dicluster domain-containing protein [Candidatus Dormibacteraeota bacterium]|nr:4Fe-4S dicluster domain-containing protein [Candidatus Dormibacteraeota bacterium]